MDTTRIEYYSIRPNLHQTIPVSQFTQAVKSELYLGPHVRLAGISGMAHLDSKALAQEFAMACEPIMKKRYGTDATLEIQRLVADNNKKLAARIARDSEIVRKRLATSNFAPNKTI